MSDSDWKDALSDAKKAYRTAKRIKTLARKGKREADSLKKKLGKDGGDE